MSWVEKYDPALERIAVLGQKHPESYLQERVIAWARANKFREPRLKNLIAIPNESGYSGGNEANKFRAIRAQKKGVLSGPSDLFLPRPDHGFAGLWVEMKAVVLRPHPSKPGVFQMRMGVVSTEQENWLVDMVEDGYAGLVAWSEREAIQAITDYLAGTWAQRPIEHYLVPPRDS